MNFSIASNPDREDKYLFCLHASDTVVAKFSDSEHAVRCMLNLQEGYPLAKLQTLIRHEQQWPYQQAELTRFEPANQNLSDLPFGRDGEEARPVGLGDVVADGEGLILRTPSSCWRLTDEDALNLLNNLTALLRYRLTCPWSEEDASTILSRGRITNLAES